MDLLSGTPYLLHEASGPGALKQARDLHDEVTLLRRQGSLEAATLARLREEWRFQQVYESAGIEGNTLTLTETQMAIQRGITVSGKPPEHSDEVRHLNSALEFLELLAASKQPLAEREIKELQRLIVGPDDRNGGGYRQIEVTITNSPHKPPPPLKVQEQMNDLATWLQVASQLPPALHAAIAHTWFVYIHPFTDGNGRTARAIMNLVLLREGYPVVIIRRKDRQRYYEALRASDQGDITPVVELIVERSRDSLRHIDRVRHAATGVSLAVQRVQEQEARAYAIWCDAIRLFRSTLDDTLRGLPSQDPQFVVSSSSYDLPSQGDFHAITHRDPSGNTWLYKFRLARRGVSHEVLLWIGFSSHELEHELKLPGAIPGIKISVTNPNPPPRYGRPQRGYQPSAREFAYHAGKFFRLNEASTGVALRPYDSLATLCAEFARDLVDAWFGG